MADSQVQTMIKLPQFFRDQVGVPGADTPLGMHNSYGLTFYVGDPTIYGVNVANDNNDGTDPLNPKATLASAYAATVTDRGDVIIMYPGNYALVADLVIAKNCLRIFGYDWMRGLGAPSAVLNGGANSDIISVEADKIELAGLRFATDGGVFSCVRAALLAATIGLHIHHNIFAVGLYGVELGVTASFEAVDVLIEKNHFMMIDDSAANALIGLQACSRTLIQKNWFTARVSKTSGLYGVAALTNAAYPETLVYDNEFVFAHAANTACFRAGTTVDVSYHYNRFSGAATSITVLADGGDHAVENYEAQGGAGGALVDATT